jgi:hypothetical protein
MSLTLVHTTIRGTAPSRSCLTGSFSSLALEDIVVIGRARSLVDVTSLTFTGVQNAQFTCLPGSWAELQLANSSVSPNMVWLVASDARCVPCGISVYNVGVQTINLVNGSVDRLQTRGCLVCPIGARFNCSGSSVGSSRHFWSNVPATLDENTTFSFLACPHHYCCESNDGCETVDF